MAERRAGAASPDAWGGGRPEAAPRLELRAPRRRWQIGVARADLAEVEQTNAWREDPRSTGQPHGFIVDTAQSAGSRGKRRRSRTTAISRGRSGAAAHVFNDAPLGQGAGRAAGQSALCSDRGPTPREPGRVPAAGVASLGHHPGERVIPPRVPLGHQRPPGHAAVQGGPRAAAPGAVPADAHGQSLQPSAPRVL